MKKLILWFLFDCIGKILPYFLIRFIASFFAILLFIIGPRRKIILTNFKIVFHNSNNSFYLKLLFKYYFHISILILEILKQKHLKISQIRNHIKLENSELLERNGKGLLILSAHIGNWELIAASSSFFVKEKVHLVVKSQNDYGYMNSVRTVFGCGLIDVGVGAKLSVSILSHKGSVAFLADQTGSKSDPVYKFFGIQTHTFTAPARLALKFKPKVIICFNNRQKNGKYVCKLKELKIDDLENNQKGIDEFIKRYLYAMEENIKQFPEQWLWSHKKWKHNSIYK